MDLYFPRSRGFILGTEVARLMLIFRYPRCELRQSPYEVGGSYYSNMCTHNYTYMYNKLQAIH